MYSCEYYDHKIPMRSELGYALFMMGAILMGVGMAVGVVKSIEGEGAAAVTWLMVVVFCAYLVVAFSCMRAAGRTRGLDGRSGGRGAAAGGATRIVRVGES